MAYSPQCSPAASLLHLGVTEALGSLMSSCENGHIQEAVTECLLSLLLIPTTKNRFVTWAGVCHVGGCLSRGQVFVTWARVCHVGRCLSRGQVFVHDVGEQNVTLCFCIIPLSFCEWYHTNFSRSLLEQGRKEGVCKARFGKTVFSLHERRYVTRNPLDQRDLIFYV